MLIRYVENEMYATTGTASSTLLGLAQARTHLADQMVLVEGDIWFDQEVLAQVLSSDPGERVAVDTVGVGGLGSLVTVKDGDLIVAWHFLSDGGPTPTVVAPDHQLCRLGNMYRLSSSFVDHHLLPFIKTAAGNNARLPLERALDDLSRSLSCPRLRAVNVGVGFWWEIDTEDDHKIAESRLRDRVS
jgi:choline kinase